ncbi:MAG: hypothetical protein WBN30_16175, partial [Polyangiales bacterium]
EEPIACENPQRGTWGGPPGGPTPRPFAAGNTALEGTTGKTLTRQLPGLIQTDIPELDLKAGALEAAPKGKADPGDGKGGPSGDASSSDGCSVSAAKSASLGWIALCIVAMWLTRRRSAT